MIEADIVVVGSGVAAGYFCKGLVENNNKLSVLIVGNEKWLPYERPALTKGYLTKGGFPVTNFLTCVGSGGSSQDADFYSSHGIKFMFETNIDKVEVANKTITTSKGEEIKARHALVLGMGSRPTKLQDFRMAVDNIKSGVHYIRDVTDTDGLIAHAKSLPKGSKIVILGGGYVGMESAAGLIGYGHHITMVFPETKVMDRFMTEPLAKFYEDRYAAAGIKIMKGDLASGLDHNEEGEVTRVDLKSGAKLAADLVIVGVGARPNTVLVRGQLDLHNKPPGGILVDQNMRSSAEGVWVIGELPAIRNGEEVNRFEHVAYARQTSLQAAKAICAMDTSELIPPLHYEPYFYSRVLNMSWVLYGNTPREGTTVHYRGDLSADGDGKFAAFWVNSQTNQVVGGFIEGGSPEQNQEVADIVKTAKLNWTHAIDKLYEKARIC